MIVNIYISEDNDILDFIQEVVTEINERLSKIKNEIKSKITITQAEIGEMTMFEIKEYKEKKLQIALDN